MLFQNFIRKQSYNKIIYCGKIHVPRETWKIYKSTYCGQLLCFTWNIKKLYKYPYAKN